MPLASRLTKALLTLVAMVPFAATQGCGSKGITIPLNPDGSVPVLTSVELATGAWTIISGSSFNSQTLAHPITGFVGALSASGTDVEGYFNISNGDPGRPYQVAACFGPQNFGVGISTVFVQGSASNGTLTLNGVFASNNTLHLVAQLSPDRRNILSGTYTVTGPCATSAPQVFGNWNESITGEYTGNATSSTGDSYSLTVHLIQGASIDGFGQIPVTGSLNFAGPACNATVQLRDATVLGFLSFFSGFTSPGPINDANIIAEENPASNPLTFDSWGFSNPTCGSVYNANSNSGLLRRN